jgi:hypothetical protein
MEQLQSHIQFEEGLLEEMRKYLTLYAWGGRLSYMTLQLLHSEFPYTNMRKI